MLTLPLAVLAVFSSLSQPAWAQADVHNVTAIGGTWSSGSGAVETGPGFANPVNNSFHYPANTGISYSFTEDGFFEQAEYRMVANGSQPNCIQGTVLFQHGTYQNLANGSLILNPIAVDGRLQVQDPCAAQSNVIMQFNTTILFQSWRIFSDPQRGPKLQLYAFDGSPKSPMFLTYNPPNMLPTTTLSANTTIGGDGLSAAIENVRKLGLMATMAISGAVAGMALLL